MGKRLAPMIAMLAMLAPVAAYALGLGNITMKSALNQPLEAEIELLSVQKGDLENLQIRLGSAEDFARVGVERTYFLTKIKFDLAQKPDGTPYVRLSSTELVTEPFLDFVVEARWPRGRILREFTVLVDPPVVSEEAPAPIQQAAAQAAPAAVAAPTQPSRPAPIRERATLSPVMSRDGVLSYGPVRPNDTLWVIANRMRPDESVSVNQMMLALLRDNPQAFYNGNVNQLKAGYVLRIKDPASITAVSVAQANAEIERQRAEWEARKSGRPLRQVAAAEPAAGADAGEAGGEGGAAAAAQARLKLVAPGSEGSGSGTGDAEVDRLRQDLVLAAEALDANRQETEELKARLSQMEEQLAAMQRLIMLKDDEMLALQKQLGAEVEAPAAVEEAAPAEQVSAEEEAVTGEGAETTAEAEAPATPTEAAKAPKPVAPAPVAEVPPAEPGLLDDPLALLENPLVMYGGIGVLVLAIVGWIIARRRKMQEGFQESILNVGGAGAAAGAATSSELAQGAGGESSMVSDFAMSEISDMSGIQTDVSEVDPISEADVYLAYGRHQQAEEILRAALESAPERNELKLKLLEVFFAAKNSEDFETEAQALHDALGDESDPLWAKAVTMGSQLCPGNPLFGAAAEALQEEQEGVAAAADDDLLDFDFDLDSPDLGESKAKAGEPDLGDEAGPGKEARAATSDDNGLDFDVSSLDFNLDQRSDDLDETPVASADEAVAAKADDDALDFDMEMLDESVAKAETVEEASPEAPQRPAEEEDADALLDLDLDLAESATGIEDTVLEFDSGDTAPTEKDEGETPSAEAQEAESGEAAQVDAELQELALGEAEQADSEQTDFSIDLSEEALARDENEAIEFDIPADEDEKAVGEFDLELDEVVESEALVVEEPADSAAGAEGTESTEEGTETDDKASKAAKDEIKDLEDELAMDDDLGDELLDEDIFGEVDEIGTKLDLAKAYVDMGDGDGARSILDEVLEEGDDTQKQQAKDLLAQIG